MQSLSSLSLSFSLVSYGSLQKSSTSCRLGAQRVAGVLRKPGQPRGFTSFSSHPPSFMIALRILPKISIKLIGQLLRGVCLPSG